MIEALFEETVIRNISSLISGINRKSALTNFAKLLEIGTALILVQSWRTVSKKCFYFYTHIRKRYARKNRLYLCCWLRKQYVANYSAIYTSLTLNNSYFIRFFIGEELSRGQELLHRVEKLSRRGEELLRRGEEPSRGEISSSEITMMS